MPEIYFENMINYKTKALRPSKDITDKIIILDYWTKGCYPCMGDFPAATCFFLPKGDSVIRRSSEHAVIGTFATYTLVYGIETFLYCGNCIVYIVAQIKMFV